MIAQRLLLVAAGTLLAIRAGGAELRLDEARALLRRGECDSAVTMLNQVVDSQPGNADAQFLLGTAYGLKAQAGGLFTAARNGHKVREHYERAVELDPKYLD